MAAPAVFCHYMVGGMSSDQALVDVSQAQALGIDAFAMNILSVEQWSLDSVAFMFTAALQYNFKLFFSFDMTHFDLPSTFFPLLLMYITSTAYYQYDGKPFVSTFWGGTQTFGAVSANAGWQEYYVDDLKSLNVTTYFVPSFSDSGVAPAGFFDTFTALDGVMNWDAWPLSSLGKANITTDIDNGYMSSAAAHDKTYLMPISTHQFKHLDSTQNWYRRGELLLTQRMAQVLAVKPPFIEILTWNDGPESTYIGNVWPYSIENSPSHAYIDDFNHTGWQTLYKSFIKAYKAGDSSIASILPTTGSVEGFFWYRPLLVDGICTNDPLGKPGSFDTAEDAIQVAVTLSADMAGSLIQVYSDGTKLESVVGVEGLNSFSAYGVKVGNQYVEVTKADYTIIISATGSTPVVSTADLCNYNYQVVTLK